jgi:hypothetical protein
MFKKYRKVDISELKKIINEYKKLNTKSYEFENIITLQVLELEKYVEYKKLVDYLESFNFKISSENKIL